MGAGGQSNALLGDPQVGLGSLDDYTATLKVSFKGTQAGQPVDLTDTYVQSGWPKLSAQFTSIDVMDDSGAHQVILSGAVGDAQYYQADPTSPCTVNWGATAGGSVDFMPAALLPQVTTAKLVDEQTLNGIATRHYTFDAASLGLPGDASASGETWIATPGGYVVKYVLDITGADSLFGTGVTGTRHLEYSLGDIGAHAQVIYPAGCDPVLSDIPAMEDASDLTRLPGLLDYSTNATQNDIFAFYQDKLTAMGWQKDTEDGIGSDSASTTFIRSDSSVGLTVAVETEGSSQRVTVMIPVPGSTVAATPNPNVTPTFGSTPTTGPVVDISSLHLPKGLTIYPGAINLDTSGLNGANGMNTLTFYSKDSPDLVTSYYNKNLNQAGWTTRSGPASTPGPDGRQVWTWTSPSMAVVSVMVTVDPGSGTDVTVTWLSL
jgi:hypothetical protein